MRPTITVRTGPGVAPDAMTYVTERLAGLARYAPRPIDAIDATVTRPRERTRAYSVDVRASLTVGGRVLRAGGAEPNLRASMDVVYDRLRRALVELPHGNRGDYVRARTPGLRMRQADVGGRHPWVLEDDAGILEVAESPETIAYDHPEAHLDDQR